MRMSLILVPDIRSYAAKQLQKLTFLWVNLMIFSFVKNLMEELENEGNPSRKCE